MLWHEAGVKDSHLGWMRKGHAVTGHAGKGSGGDT